MVAEIGTSAATLDSSTPPPAPPSIHPPAPQAAVAAVLVTGVLNRVLYRIALVPMKDHVFALAQLQNMGYIAIYFTLLWLRVK